MPPSSQGTREPGLLLEVSFPSGICHGTASFFSGPPLVPTMLFAAVRLTFPTLVGDFLDLLLGPFDIVLKF